MTTTVHFDFDGTLLSRTTSIVDLFVETLPSHATKEIAETYSDQVLENLSQKEENPYEQAFVVVCEEHNVKRKPGKLAAEYTEKAASATHILPPVRRFVATIATRHQTGIHITGDRQLQRHKIREHGLENLVETVLITDGDGSRKSNQEIFEEAKTRLPTDTFIYISDTLKEGIVPAHNAGFNTVYVGDKHREDGLTSTSGAEELAKVHLPVIDSDAVE